MDCKKADKFLLLSMDGRLGEKEQRALENHLLGCASCQEKEKEYREAFSLLRLRQVPEPLPHFEERVLAKLRYSEKEAPALFWPRWAARAAAVFFIAAIFLSAGLLFLQQQESQELSQAEVLLLHNENPLTEAATILEQKKPEERNMMLIFAAAEMRAPVRR